MHGKGETHAQSRVDADLSFGDGILPTIITTHRKDVDRINRKSLEKLTANLQRLDCFMQ